MQIISNCTQDVIEKAAKKSKKPKDEAQAKKKAVKLIIESDE